MQKRRLLLDFSVGPVADGGQRGECVGWFSRSRFKISNQYCNILKHKQIRLVSVFLHSNPPHERKNSFFHTFVCLHARRPFGERTSLPERNFKPPTEQTVFDWFSDRKLQIILFFIDLSPAEALLAKLQAKET